MKKLMATNLMGFLIMGIIHVYAGNGPDKGVFAEKETSKRKKNYVVSKFKDAVALVKGDLFYTEWTDDNGTAYARMLFDHATDPLEFNNLAEKEEYKNIVAQLAKELREKWGKDFFKKQ